MRIPSFSCTNQIGEPSDFKGMRRYRGLTVHSVRMLTRYR